jgi:hypothetical protein
MSWKKRLIHYCSDTVKARIEQDPKFRDDLLCEGIEHLLSGDAETGKAILKDYFDINTNPPMQPITLTIPVDKHQQIEALAKQRGSSIEDVTDYALQLGLKLIMSELDSEQLIWSLQELGEPPDIILMMAKKKSRKSYERIQDTAMYQVGKQDQIDWEKNNIPPEAYSADDYDLD